MSKFRKTLVGCSVLGLTVVAYGQSPNQQGQNVTSASRTIIKDTAIRLMLKPVESIDWVEKTLEEIIEWLDDEGEGGVNVIPRWTALGAEGVNNESVVTIKLKNITIADVLNEVIEQLSEDGQLAYRAIDNNLRISTKGDFNRKLYRRVYDATDILFRVPNFGEESPQIDLQTTSKGGGGGSGGGQSVFSGGSSSGGSKDDAGTQAEQKELEQLDKLMNTIASSIEPQSWGSIQTSGVGGRGAAGPVGTGPGRISSFNRSLIVYNTIEVHEQIVGKFMFGKN